MRSLVLRLMLAGLVSATVIAPLPSSTATPSPAAAVAATPATADDDPAPRVRSAGRWLVAPSGKVLVLHGVNMVSKLAPYAPDSLGFGRDDARFLVRNGLTTVRLGLIWKAVEPQPGVYDDAYLARIRRTTRILAMEGVHVLLDFHQDLYHEKFQGEGAPDWAVQDDGLPALPQLGFPYNYFGMLALNRAFDHFWANDPGPGGVGLQDRYAAAWRHVAAYFRSTDRVLGFDLFNEPWPGSLWAACANPLGCPLFDAQLQAFSQRSIDAIRRSDKRTMVFYEPNVLFNNGAATSVSPTGGRLGFSFHDYCLTADVGLEGTPVQDLTCDGFDDLVWQNADAHVKQTGHPPLLTEFGATTDQKVLRGMVDRAAAHGIGWQYWAYCGCGDPTTTGPGSEQALVFDPAKPPTGDNVDWAKMRALVVPHPLLVAGTPGGWSFDRATKVFRTHWSTARAGSAPGRFAAGATTRIALPALVYRDSYRVRVTGGSVLSAPGARTLVVRQSSGVSGVHVVVRPR